MYRLILIIVFLCSARIAGAADNCQVCHENRQTMERAGYGHFTITRQEVEAQSHMPAACSGCHLGDPAAADKEQGHKGLARLLVTRSKGFVTDTAPRSLPLDYGTSPVNRILVSTMKDGKKVRDASVAAISWHDKRSDTITQDFATMGKTCGTCHEKEFREFSQSVMGTNGKQSQYKGWLDERRGPHNCGPWFEGNFEAMQANTTVPLTRYGNAVNQKVCNSCHVGCLDCHFNPQSQNPANPGQGPHTFSKTPPAASCYGNGRASLCHAGPEDRRRGAGYFGGQFSFPEGSESDIHLRAGVGCLDCHESSKSNKSLGHGMVRRQAAGACARCHADAVRNHAASLHKNLSCEACHIRNVAGYQATYWGPGKLAGLATPYFKFKAYYGIMVEPFLIRDQKGRWIPVKPFPMAVLNQRESPFTPGLKWRYPPELPDLQRTDDAWAYVGLFDGLPKNNKALLWIQIDKMSHKLGKSRTCDSCHAALDGAQRQDVSWEYGDPGAFPFSGGHTVFADRTGLYIRDIHAEKIQSDDGYSIADFAPWLYLQDKWQVKGDFSLPVIRDRARYEVMKTNSEKAGKAGATHR